MSSRAVAISAGPGRLVRGRLQPHAQSKPAGPGKPIVDTHIHIFQVTRPGGVPWPPPANKTLYKDFSTADYKAMAAQNGITGAVIVEASPIYDDNVKLLSQIKGDKFYRGLVGNLEVGQAGLRREPEQAQQASRSWSASARSCGRPP